LRRLGITGITALTIGAVAAMAWLVFPGLPNMLVRPSLRIDAPVSTMARVRHDRGFSGEFARIHEFTFNFRNDATGQDQNISSSVIGFFGLWSDPRFDYLALARFVREDCKPERAARVYEFGWSVPCSRDNVPIVYAQADPSRFRVVGYDYEPGYVARGVRLVLAGFLGLLAILVAALGMPVIGRTLWDLFIGDEEPREQT
jgi:hypothetical protein